MPLILICFIEGKVSESIDELKLDEGISLLEKDEKIKLITKKRLKEFQDYKIEVLMTYTWPQKKGTLKNSSKSGKHFQKETKMNSIQEQEMAEIVCISLHILVTWIFVVIF